MFDSIDNINNINNNDNDNDNIDKLKHFPNIYWIGFTLSSFIINWYFEYVLYDIEDTNLCYNYIECNNIIEELVDKNDFIFNITTYFLIIQILLLLFNFTFNLSSNTFLNIPNVFGLIYLTMFVWTNCLFYMYWDDDDDFYYHYKNFMHTSKYLHPVRFIINYYMFFEIGVFLFALIFILFLFIFVIFKLKSLYLNITNDSLDKKLK